jgi:transcription initiation factor TFIIB
MDWLKFAPERNLDTEGRSMRQSLRLDERKLAEFHRKGELTNLLSLIARISTKLDLSSEIRRRACSICADAVTVHKCHGIPRPVLAAASLYISSREAKVPVTLRELAEASGSDLRFVGKCYVSMLEAMHISRPELNGRGYVYHLALKKPVSDQALAAAQETIRTATLKGLAGRNPMTLAAASLYLACCGMGENVTQAELAEAAGVGEESVRECCRAVRLTMALPS